MTVTISNVRILYSATKANVDKIDAALAKYRAAEAALYDADKTPLYNPKHHETKIAEAIAPLKEAVASVHASIEAFNSVVEELQLSLATEDPLDKLDPEQLATADAWRGFVQDDLAATNRYGMPLRPEAVRDRLQAVLNGDDAAKKAVYLREARRWTDAQQSEGRLQGIDAGVVSSIRKLVESAGDGSKDAEELAEMRLSVNRMRFGPVAAANDAVGIRRYIDPVSKQVVQQA